MIDENSSFWRETKSATHDALTSPVWLNQQAWVMVTEILMGFLVAWAITRNVPQYLIGMGLGLVYFTTSVSMHAIRLWGRTSAYWSMGITLLLFLVSSFFGSVWSFLGVCVGAGFLLTMRDMQTIRSMAWIPVRARRKKHSAVMSLIMTSILSSLILACLLTLAGWISMHWKWLPHFLLLLTFAFLVPRMFTQIGAHGEVRKNPVMAHKDDTSWLLRLGLAFNAVNFLGRRFIIPVAILQFTNVYLHTDQNLTILGAIMGFIGVISALIRAPMMLSQKTSGMTLMRWGARLSLLGWTLLCLGLLGWSFAPWIGILLFAPIVMGWILLELTNRTWSIAYMDQLHSASAGPRIWAVGAHRRVLYQFMVRKSAGASIGCVVGGVLAPSVAPLAALFFVFGSAVVLEYIPKKT